MIFYVCHGRWVDVVGARPILWLQLGRAIRRGWILLQLLKYVYEQHAYANQRPIKRYKPTRRIDLRDCKLPMFF